MRVIIFSKLEKVFINKSKKIIKYFKKYVKKPTTKRIEVGVFIFILFIFALKATNYFNPRLFKPTDIYSSIQNTYTSSKQSFDELKYFRHCPESKVKVEIGQKYLCRDKTPPSIYQKIYDTYQLNPKGKEIIYRSLDTGTISVANDFINNQYDVSRYNPIKLNKPLTWTEDPYNDRYWRFNIYSLRDFKDLLYAYETTRDPQYSQKLLTIIDSFLDTGVKQPHAWDDYHAVAWRTMVLTDVWWKLRMAGVMPIDMSNKILAAIEEHGQFLRIDGHYEPQFNHGTNEAAALYLIGVNFPDLPNASTWLAVGKQRLSTTLDTLIDEDGALTEHSPYYHFYVMQKYWEIERYSLAQKQQISSGFDHKIKDMIHYATYILQPDLHVPLLGASLDRQIHNDQEFAEMANMDPQFKYVLSRGKSGNKPSDNIQFKNTGETIMRSGWNPKNFTQQTQVVFNYGAYSTQHSHLDTLGFSLYGGGKALLPGPGLYTYNPGAFYNYFVGTAASNTVLVDNQSQQQGSGVAGVYMDKGDYVSQSASEQLNPGVTHERQITLIGSKTVVVIDKLHSESEHTYQQMFHLFNGAEYSHEGLSINAKGQKAQEALSIQQLAPKGITLSDVINDQDPAHIQGVCSQEYAKLSTCRAVIYTQKAKDATFITVLEVGKPDKTIHYSLSNDQKTVSVFQAKKSYDIHINEMPGVNTKVTASDTKTSSPNETPIDEMTDPNLWQTKNATLQSTTDAYAKDKSTLILNGTNNQMSVMTKDVTLNLNDKNLVFRIKVPNANNIKDLDIIMYSNNNSYAQNRLMNSYKEMHSGEWMTISLSKGIKRDEQGQWSVYGDGFDWSSIHYVEFRLDTKDGSPGSLLVGKLSTYPEQKEGKVAIVFDDGYASINPAVDVLDRHGFKASVAVIAKYPSRKQSGYLQNSDLISLKNKGWSIINHSYYHLDAVADYYDKNNMAGYENDVLQGAIYLSSNGLVTDENWYIDPHGATNNHTESIASKYYKYIRTTLQGPEAFPFGSPTNIKTFGVQNNTDVAAVKKAIDDANTFHQTLFLTFHRIHSTTTDKPGYSLDAFGQIVDYLSSTKSNVMSLNQLDSSNNVSANHLSITKGYPAQLNGNVNEHKGSLLARIKDSIF